MKRNLHAFTLVELPAVSTAELPAVSKSKRAAFTLVELLVVIGIIAVLISILLPALNTARQQAYSAQCLSNLKQIGQAALMYAGENHGWFPPGHASNPNGAGSQALSRTDSCFVDWGPVDSTGTNPNPSRWSVSEAMAKYAGYKVIVPWKEMDTTTGPSAGTISANYAAGWVPVRTPVFYCPTAFQTIAGAPAPLQDNNLLSHDFKATNSRTALDNTKMTYLWVANPYHAVDPTTYNYVITTFGGNEDLLAATNGTNAVGGFAHMDVYPNQQTAGAKVDFDTGRPNRPGYDYLRKTSDKRAQEVQICVDNPRQQGAAGSLTRMFYYPHGNMNGARLGPVIPGSTGATGPGGGYQMTLADRAWFNELFGDGHAESRRGDQLNFHWSSSAPQAW